MARGIWRWWQEKDGADVWSAHVEQRPGEWIDVEAADYERAGLQPSFWSLPLKEEYLEGRLDDRVAPPNLMVRERDIVLPAIVGMITFGGAVFVILVLAAALVAKAR